MRRWTPALALLFVRSASWAGDIKVIDAPAPLPADKPLVAPLDPSLPAVAAPLATPLAPVSAEALQPAQPPALAPSAVAAAPAVQAAANGSSPSRSASGEALPSGAAGDSARWSGVFDQAKAAQPLALDVPAAAADVDAAVFRTRGRRFPGVFIQQEHEGNLIQADPRDSSGDVFRYYRPKELLASAVGEVKAGMTKGEKAVYALRFLSGRDDWKRFSLTSKLKYLAAYEKAVAREKGAPASWSGDTFLLLEKTKQAPGFLADHPIMEVPPEGYDHLPYAKFLRPEIVTAKNAPAATIDEAIGRAKLVIGDTAHAGIHYHVFMKLKPAELESRLRAIEGLLQLANNAYYAEAAGKSPQNLAHPFLTPWHEGRSRRVEELVRRAERTPVVSEHGDPDGEKFAFVAFRYWGTENGLMTVSFELRGVGIPWERKGGARSMTRGVEETAPALERSYKEPERRLALLMLAADAITRGTMPEPEVASVKLDEEAAERALAARALERGMPAGSYASLAELSSALFGAPHGYAGAHPGLLLPFGVEGGAPVPLLDAYLDEAARVKALARDPALLADQKRNITYVLWSAYAEWSQRYARGEQRKLDRLLVELSR